MLASAFATSTAAVASGAAPHNLQHSQSPPPVGSPLSGDAPEADGKKQAASLGGSGLSRLKKHLAEGDGPTLDDFIAGGNDAAASPYSVYAPGFKVSTYSPTEAIWLLSSLVST